LATEILKICQISTYTNDFDLFKGIFHGEDGTNLPDFEDFFFKSPDFHDKFQ
jgi:hypothetical protein